MKKLIFTLMSVLLTVTVFGQLLTNSVVTTHYSACYSNQSITLQIPSNYSFIYSNGSNITWHRDTTFTGNHFLPLSQYGYDTIQYTNVSGIYRVDFCCNQPSLFDTIHLNRVTTKICMVTTDSLSHNNIIVWDKSVIGVVDTFMVYRDTANNNYVNIGKVPYDSLSMFTDTARTHFGINGGNPNVASWRYKIGAKDTCGNISLMSSFHQTVFFQQNSGNFTWNQYSIEGEASPIPSLSNYLLQRDNFSNGNWTTITTLSANNTSASDPNYNSYKSTATWRVKVVIPGCNATEKAVSVNGKSISINTVSNVYKDSSAPTNVGELINKINVNIYPNPSTGSFQINTSVDTKLVKIFNMVGALVYQSNLTSNTSNIEVNLESNVYQVCVYSDNGFSSTKLVIVK